MPGRLRLRPQPSLADSLAAIRAELQVPAGFPPAVADEADAVARRGPDPALGRGRRDATGIPFVAVDPPGSRDLDQVFHAERTAGGYRVHYAIADVGAFVAPGGPLDAESLRRGLTLYLPDGKAPLYPEVLSQGAASLLPDGDRPALLWTHDLDADGNLRDTRVERATVRNRAALGYPEVQARLDAGTAPEPLVLLREIGLLRDEAERERGGVSLQLPAQEIVSLPDGHATLAYEAPLPVEDWNAQISLLTGMAAAVLMAEAGVGLVRTLPPPPADLLARLRRTAMALGVRWPQGARYADVVRGLDPAEHRHAAFLTQAARVLRGSGYAVIDTPGAAPVHAAVAAPYAHVTAPLRRLCDRPTNEVLLAVCAGHPPPEPALAALPAVVEAMAVAARRERAVERACIDAVECVVLAGREGEAFDAVVVDHRADAAVVQLLDPAVVATVPGRPRLGRRVTARLQAVDGARREVRFTLG